MSFNVWNETPRSITEIVADLKFENKQLRAIIREKDRQLEQLEFNTLEDWQKCFRNRVSSTYNTHES